MFRRRVLHRNCCGFHCICGWYVNIIEDIEEISEQNCLTHDYDDNTLTHALTYRDYTNFSAIVKRATILYDIPTYTYLHIIPSDVHV